MPTIQLSECTQCMKCVKDCPADAINITSGIISNTCIHCGHCVSICPESTIFPDNGDILPLKVVKFTADDYQDLVAGLRSVRSYKAEQIPMEVIEQLVDHMKYFASASNARPLRITVVRSPGKIKLINDLTLDTILRPIIGASCPFLKPFLRIFAPTIDLNRLANYRASFLEKSKTNDSLVCHHAPLLMLFHAPVKKYGLEEADANIWATHTTLFAKTLGLGSCFIGFIVKAMERNRKIKSAVGIPPDQRVYAALILGYPKVNYRNEATREKPEYNLV